MSDIKAILKKLEDLFTITDMDWSLSVHHCLTEPTCPTVVIEPEDMQTARYRIDADSIEQGIAEAAERVYREVVLHETIEPMAPFTNPNDKCLESMLAAWARGEKPEPPGPKPDYREQDRFKLRRKNATLRSNLAAAQAENTSLHAELLRQQNAESEVGHRNQFLRTRITALEQALATCDGALGKIETAANQGRDDAIDDRGLPVDLGDAFKFESMAEIAREARRATKAALDGEKS